jgi:hypothetical protein
MIFQHDGARAHFHNQVVNFLNQEFPENIPRNTHNKRRYDGTNTTSIRCNPKRDTKARYFSRGLTQIKLVNY